RVTGGIGTSAPGLWQGEVYGGYQAEKNDIVGTYDSGVFGIRVGYSPTRMWDLKASLDETLGASRDAFRSNIRFRSERHCRHLRQRRLRHPCRLFADADVGPESVSRRNSGGLERRFQVPHPR